MAIKRKNAVPMVRVEGVSKAFKLHQEKSLKEVAIAVLRRRSRTNKFTALNNINFEIDKGESVGLVGHNGSGKSTLLKIIGGIISPTEGEVWRRGKLAALLELGAGFHPDLTGRENVFLNASILGMTRAETSEMMDSIIAFSDIGLEFIDSQVKFYSSGMYVRLAFAVAVHSNPDVLLIDEVLAVGDEPFQHKCLMKIQEFQKQGKTIIFVSHSAQQVADVCSRVIVLQKGHIVFDGDAQTGLDVLHQGYSEKEDSPNVKSSSSGNSDAEVSLITLNSGRNTELNCGDTVTVDVDFTAASTQQLVLNIDILGPQREVLFRTTSQNLGLKISKSKKLQKVSIHLPQTNFGVSQIGARAFLTTTKGEWIASLDSEQRIPIKQNGRGSGVFQFEAFAKTINN